MWVWGWDHECDYAHDHPDMSETCKWLLCGWAVRNARSELTGSSRLNVWLWKSSAYRCQTVGPDEDLQGERVEVGREEDQGLKLGHLTLKRRASHRWWVTRHTRAESRQAKKVFPEGRSYPLKRHSGVRESQTSSPLFNLATRKSLGIPDGSCSGRGGRTEPVWSKAKRKWKVRTRRQGLCALGCLCEGDGEKGS